MVESYPVEVDRIKKIENSLIAAGFDTATFHGRCQGAYLFYASKGISDSLVVVENAADGVKVKEYRFADIFMLHLL